MDDRQYAYRGHSGLHDGDYRFSIDIALCVGIGGGWSGRVITGVTVAQRGGPTLGLGGEYGGIGAHH
jgi:hypothetical protein